MPFFEITDEQKMLAILTVFSKLDDIRWKEASNYNLINYCRDDLTADEKLLTHYLCYIMDRQMSYQRIWDIGGYVISHIVHKYISQPETEDLDQVLNPYINRKGGEISLISPGNGKNDVLRRYGIYEGSVSFASRYMPEDLISIYRTLGILNHVAQRSMAHYICIVLGEEENLEQGIKKIAIALNQLTYLFYGKVSGKTFDNRYKETKRQVQGYKLDNITGVSLFKRKRLWRSLRDYLKSPEFNPHFVVALRDAGYSRSCKWKRDSIELRTAMKALELPGDVWNNANIFRKGLFKPYISNERKNWDMPQTIREIYNIISKTKKTCFYPEQLDVTFDFVPRMCQRSMCSVCFFGEGIGKVCHKKKGLLCPIALYSCGYKHQCNPSSCDFKYDKVRGFCQSTSSNAGVKP